MECRATIIHCDDCTSLFPPSCFPWMSLDERSNVGRFCCFRLRVGDLETLPSLICSESCEKSKDGICDDGSFGSAYDFCAFGTDCTVGLRSKNDLSKKLQFCV
jgi:hypothetical protein